MGETSVHYQWKSERDSKLSSVFCSLFIRWKSEERNWIEREGEREHIEEDDDDEENKQEREGEGRKQTEDRIENSIRGVLDDAFRMRKMPRSLSLPICGSEDTAKVILLPKN